jgi:hypothetical protein
MVGGGGGRYILGSFLKRQNFIEVVGFKSSGFINSEKKQDVIPRSHCLWIKGMVLPNYGWTPMPPFHMNLNIQCNLTFRLRQ